MAELVETGEFRLSRAYVNTSARTARRTGTPASYRCAKSSGQVMFLAAPRASSTLRLLFSVALSCVSDVAAALKVSPDQESMD